MGGAAKLNLNEFNLSCDPEAADVVFSSKIPKKVVTLDVTFRCRLSKAQTKRLSACGSDAVRTVMRMSALWGDGMILHDPLTLGAAISERIREIRKRKFKSEYRR